jgi:hypothetical protein
MFAGRGVSNLQRRPVSPVRTNQIVPPPANVDSNRLETPQNQHLRSTSVFWPKLSRRNPFGIRTYRECSCNLFRIRTYQKPGGKGCRAQSITLDPGFQASRPCSFTAIALVLCPSGALNMRKPGHDRGRGSGGNIQKILARPERLELPTLWFEARCSIQLSYGRANLIIAIVEANSPRHLSCALNSHPNPQNAARRALSPLTPPLAMMSSQRQYLSMLSISCIRNPR